MKTNIWQRKTALLFAMLVIAAFAACKKSKVKPDPAPEPPSQGSNVKQTPTTDRTQLTSDSLFLYAKEVYYWNDVLPSYDDFEPRKYGSNLNSELFAITRYKVDPTTSKPYEYRTSNPNASKYSYIEDITTRNPVAALPNEQSDVDLEGNGNDVGIFSVSAIGVSATAYKLFILAVDKGSPADLFGLTRGTYITKINSTPIGNKASFETVERGVINANIYGDPASIYIEGVKTDGTTFATTLAKKSYKSSPVLKTNVITVGAKKIGYLAYARFSNEDNSFAALDAVFTDFSSKGVTDLVVDLRYNGGGYVNTAERLVNLIAPSTATGVMYKEYYNSMMQNNKATILKNQPYLDANDKVQYKNGRVMNYYEDIDYSVARNTRSFSKRGNLTGVTNIVFIVSGNTASASELVINSLKPKMNVKLVGLQTYGKPIGFFPVRIQNKYDVFLSMFETKNSQDAGGYYTGMTPDVNLDKDFGDYDFGDPSEQLLAAAINVLAPQGGAVSAVSRNKVLNVSPGTDGVYSLGKFDQHKEFIGMIENRPAARP